jgi:hypothetical protein
MLNGFLTVNLNASIEKLRIEKRESNEIFVHKFGSKSGTAY